MKKLLLILAAAVFTLALAGCSGGSGASSGSADTSASGEATETVVKGELAWKDSKNMEEAGEAAGFTNGFTLPDLLPIGDYKWSEPTFTYMENVAEANYDGGEACACVRKGEGVPLKDLSADLNDYKFDWTQDCDGIEVTCHGYEEGIANFLEWTRDDCSYDVWCVSTSEDNIGMNEEEVAAMVAGVL